MPLHVLLYFDVKQIGIYSALESNPQIFRLICFKKLIGRPEELIYLEKSLLTLAIVADILGISLSVVIDARY
jgi:hypothetical protein